MPGAPTDADIDIADVDLGSAAHSGDASALGTLLLRHRPGMLAVAISLLGYGPDAEDAVQEASLVALRRIGDLRDPAAVGAWLRAVVRNICRMRLRSNSPMPTGDDLAALPSAEPDPAQLLERSAFHDWIWHAIDELSAAMDRDLSDGVKFRLTNVIGDCDTVIYETAMINPADDPDHCPPSAAWVQHLNHGRVERMRIMHARRPDVAAAA